jgi:adhesin/invasin
VPFGAATSLSFAGGVAKVSSGRNGVMKLYAAENAQITVSDHASLDNGAGLPVTVGVGSLAAFSVTTPGTQTAGTPFNLTIAAKDEYGNGLSGSQAMSFSGANSSPSEKAPSYPATVTFTNGTGTASVTLYAADSTTSVTATRGSVNAGTGNFAVNAGAAAKLAWSGASSSYFFAEEEGLCLFTCTWSGIGKNHTWSAKVSVTDASGNVVSNVGGGHVITWAPAPSGGGNVTPSSLTLPSTGTATTSSSVVYTSPNNNGWSTDTFTAHTSGYGDATVLLKR